MKPVGLIFGILLTSTLSFAQNAWYFSPRVGMNFVPVKESEASGNMYKLGPSLGISAGKEIAEKMGIELGLSVNRRTSHYFNEYETDELAVLKDFLAQQGLLDFLGEELFSTYEIVDGYSEYWTLDVPITASYRLSEGLHVFLGVYGNYMVSVENKEEITTHIPILEVSDLSGLGVDQNILNLLPQNGTETEFNSSKENLNEFDFGVLGGIGYQSNRWIMRAAYQYGFVDIRTDDLAYGINNSQAINISLGYLIYGDDKSSMDKPRYDLDLIK